MINIPFLQYINKTGFRVCLKELYQAKYDPVSVTYTVLSGKSSTATKLINFSTYKSLNNKTRIQSSNTQKELYGCAKTERNQSQQIAFGWWWKNNVHPFFYIVMCIMVGFIMLANISVLYVAFILSWTKNFCFAIFFSYSQKTEKAEMFEVHNCT